MIIRSAFRCLICDQTHVVRIGMGHDDRQVHRFPCRKCGEEMVIALSVDHKNVSAVTEAVDNAERAEEGPDDLVVNLHANFVIAEADRYKDRSFSHLTQMLDQARAAEKYGSLKSISLKSMKDEGSRPFRRPDYVDEWAILKKSWSLHMRGQSKLSVKLMTGASAKFYSKEPLDNIEDWVWRFAMFLGATKYEKILMDMMSDVRGALSEGAFSRMLAEREEGRKARATLYFNIIRDYFAGWHEFSQVHFAVAKGIPVPDGYVATTGDFNSVKMFYGNAVEAFALSVDILAFMNNVLSGRGWDQFSNINAEAYLRSDKARRFDCLSERPAFFALCAERDNRLRNASHHSALNFDSDTGLLSYREGKGNSGNSVTISYAEYLSRCATIFFQLVTLLRFELLICQQTGSQYPI